MLIVAVRLGFLEVCKWLLGHGCKEDIDHRGPWEFCIAFR